MSLSQLQKQVSYLTYEIQNGAGGGGIQTINDLMHHLYIIYNWH
jgi:hypothetical protein